MERGLYTALLAAWAAAFVVEAGLLAHRASALARATERVEGLYTQLDSRARQTEALAFQTRRASEELGFLQALPSLLPQDKGYRRTQKAVADEVAGLRRKLAPRLKNSIYVVVDAKANKLYLKKGFKLLWEADCSVGRGGMLRDRATGQRWEFVTPRGEFKVLSKGENALWRKPDWAFAEAGEKIPPPNDPSRLVAGELGAYFLNLGDGYLIHGTKNEKILGRPASHGCVRLGADDLKDLYAKAPVGTRVFIIY